MLSRLHILPKYVGDIDDMYHVSLITFVSRNTSVGVCAFFTRIGGVVSPQVVLLVSQYQSLTTSCQSSAVK